MNTIEPELLSLSLPFLKEKYQHETEADRKKRADHYNDCYAKYDEKYATFTGLLQQKKRSNRHLAMQSAEEKDRTLDLQKLSELESLILS